MSAFLPPRALTVALAWTLVPLNASVASPPAKAVADDASAPSAAGAPALVEAIAPLLSDRALAGARIGVLITRADGSGEPVYALAADEALHPASNTKLLTTAAALVTLGPTYVFTTDVVTPEPLVDGVAPTLFLVGRGDPTFMTENLWKLLDEARVAGLREVAGDLVVDESFFTKEHTPPGFESQRTDEAFRAPSGAASLNFNQVSLTVTPGATVGAPAVVRLSPEGGYATVKNATRTRAKGRSKLNVKVVPKGERVEVVLTGSLPLDAPPFTTRRRIENPAVFLGTTARHLLAQMGIPVRGQVKTGTAPASATLLGRTASRPLAVIVGDVNKYSNNFMAEQLVRTLGAVRRGRGDWTAGRAVVLEWARTELRREILRYANGSGLFGDTAMSPRDLVRVLTYMQTRRPALPEFAASLAIGGLDGTMWKRARSFEPYTIRAKTGTLDGVVALSGYAPFADGTLAAFSILTNEVTGRGWEVWRVHEQMLALLGAFDPTTGTLRPPLASPVAPPSAP